ncbi:MAG TPA: hypothetical protein PKA14_03325 [Leptospiraceae bacterium]|nr:hypothetical protein [Leptospiraceae bacterium]
MLINILKYIIFFTFTFSLRSEKENTVQIEWEKAPGAVYYRLEIKDSQDIAVYSEKTAGTVLNVRLSSGKEYSRRIVSIDKTGEEFASEWTPVLLVSQTEKRSRIRLEWEKNNRSDYYIAEIRDSDGKTLIRRKVKKTETEVELLPGKYEKRILAVDKTGDILASSWTDLEVIRRETENKKYDIIIRSASFPGWGQVYSFSAYGYDARIRGYSIMTISVLLAGTYAYYVKQAERQKRQFNHYADNAIFFSAAAGDSLFSVQDIYNFSAISHLIEKEKNSVMAGRAANTALGLLGAVYAVQFADAFRIQRYILPKLSMQVGRNFGNSEESFFSFSAQFNF